MFSFNFQAWFPFAHGYNRQAGDFGEQNLPSLAQSEFLLTAYSPEYRSH